MEPDKNTTPESEEHSAQNEHPEGQPQEQQAPADALSLTPEEIEEEVAQNIDGPSKDVDIPAEKKLSPVKRFFRKVNVFFLGFLLIVAVAAAIAITNYLNSAKTPTTPDIAAQKLTEDDLKQLANTDVSVGGSSQTLTIQGNAIIAGQTLMRGNLNVAGSFQSAGNITGPSITVAGAGNFGDTQTKSLKVQGDAAIQGTTTLAGLDVAGASSFSGAIKASQLTVSKLILSGNATLEAPNHIGFTGPSPSRTINPVVLGSGGSASVNGSDTTGTVDINTGGNTTVGCFVHVSFRQAFTNQPHVIISPIGSAAGRTDYYASRDKNGFSICTSSPAPAHQSFAFDYFVTN